MLKVKQKLATILLACMTALMAICTAFGLLLTPVQPARAEDGTWTLVTDASTLAVDDQVVIVASASNYALSTTQNGNNRGTAEVTKNGDTITFGDNVQILTLEEGTTADTFAFNTGNAGYLYCASTSTKNYLRTQASKDAKASWTITITNAVATIKSNVSGITRNILKYNNSSSCFACYSSGQADVSIYKFISNNPPEPTCDHSAGYTYTPCDPDAEGNPQHIETCKNCGAEKEGSTAQCSVQNENWSEWTTVNGEHTRTGTCKDCSATLTETGKCEINNAVPVPVPNDNKHHTITGTCQICKYETTASYECQFEQLEDTDTYTSFHCECGNNYTLNKYTITYNVPTGIATVEPEKVLEGSLHTFKTAGTTEGYTFFGWTTQPYEASTSAPEIVFETGASYEMGAADVTLYALYTYSEGGSGNYEKVTSTPADWSGKYLIVYEDGKVAFDGALTALDAANNNIVVTISDGKIERTDETAAAYFTIAKSGDSYTIQSASGYYIGQTTNDNGLKSNTSTAYTNTLSINSDTVNIISGGAYLRYNDTSGQNRFRYYKSGSYTNQKALALYKLAESTTHYTTAFAACTHDNATETIIAPTCTAPGATKIECTCGYNETITNETAPALGHAYDKGVQTVAPTCQAKEVITYTCTRENCGHSYTQTAEEYGDHNIVDGTCTICGIVDPLSVDYSGVYFLAFMREDEDFYMYVNNSWANSRYTAYSSFENGGIQQYVFTIVKNEDGTYNVHDLVEARLENVSIVKNGEYYNIFNNNDEYFSMNSDAKYDYVKFYPSEQLRDITFIECAHIDAASITVGQDLVMNYKVSMSEDFAGAEMTFTMNDKTTTVTGNKVGTQYVYSLNIAPQCMGDKISAVLKFGDTVLATKAEYSVTDYAEYQLNNNPSDELKQLLVDMLHYGAAAQVYQNYKTDALATSILTEEQKTLASTATAEESDSVFELSSAKNPAYFTGAGVYFAAQNKLYVKLSTTENVKLEIDGVEVALNSTTVFTEGIFATDFDKKFTFTLYYNDEEVQTLTYSVNSYVYEYAQQSDTDPTMVDLANTLYRYGIAAEAYANTQNNQA